VGSADDGTEAVGVELVQGQRAQGRTVAEVLGSLGVARSSY
jgi:hypothetical protein